MILCMSLNLSEIKPLNSVVCAEFVVSKFVNISIIYFNIHRPKFTYPIRCTYKNSYGFLAYFIESFINSFVKFY